MAIFRQQRRLNQNDISKTLQFAYDGQSMTNSSSYTMSTHRWVFAIAILVVLVVVDSLHEILSHFAAVVFALLASSPMLIGFALTRSVTPHIEPITILFLTMFSPIVEEIEFRGLGVRNLQRGTGWPFWITVWPQALLFGWGHVEQGQRFQEMAGLMLLTGSGAVVFAWLLYRWQSLWFPVALHVCMNLWWVVFSVAKNALGGWLPFVLQTGTVILAIGITFYWTARKDRLPAADG